LPNFLPDIVILNKIALLSEMEWKKTNDYNVGRFTSGVLWLYCVCETSCLTVEFGDG
jgi:hypothetical protein